MLALSVLQEAAGKVPSPFDINGGVILWTIGIFLVLLGLLWWKGWPEILKMVEEREHRIQKQLDEAEKARAEAQQLLEEHKKLVAQGRAAAQEDSGHGQVRRQQRAGSPAGQDARRAGAHARARPPGHHGRGRKGAASAAA